MAQASKVEVCYCERMIRKMAMDDGEWDGWWVHRIELEKQLGQVK